MTPANSPRQREIRVFVSSTFVDMQDSREELVKQVFPQLRHLCESRGVPWGEVDLRWGVPDEATAEGRVLPLCLAEIERCPYFIGLLGERFGWVPDEIPADLLQAQPWLGEQRKQSVTAIEILYGALRNPEKAGRAFFYFRDPGDAATCPGFTEENPERRERLAALKDDIRRSGFPVRENFATPQQLGEWVLRDLTAAIKGSCPDLNPPDPVDRAAADHEAYGLNRRRLYIGRTEYFERLDAHAADEGLPLVVLGDPGSGKSALLANWTHRWREQHYGTPVLVHFIGASPDSANWMAMLRRLLGEFRRVGIQIEIPDQPDALRLAFASALHMAAARGRTVLVIDALNQIEDRDGAPDLIWLPPVIPANMRLVVSTLPGRALDAMSRLNWPTLTVRPLERPERETLIVDYLKQYAKELSLERRQRIAVTPQSANGLYLTTLLNELRLFGSREQLDERIGWYLKAANPFELYSRVIQRWERDYEERGSGSEDIVGESLSRIWAARRGLSEIELLESLGKGSRLSSAVWSPLFLAAGDALMNRGGLLTFAHDFLREAVREAYLPTTGHQQNAHRTLALYFGGQPQGPRQLDELPWQWKEAGEWGTLADVLVLPGFFGALWDINPFDVKAYWTQIEAQSLLRMEDVYSAAIGQPTRDPGHAWRIGHLLTDTGKLGAALTVWATLVEHYRKVGDRSRLPGVLGNYAGILRDRGELGDAMALYKEVNRLYRELDDKDGVQRTLSEQAIILTIQGEPHDAMVLLKERERFCRELGSKTALLQTLNNQALILMYAEPDDAMARLREAERLCRELADKDGLARTLNNQALILKNRGKLDQALARLEEAERLCRQLGSKDGLESTLGNRANILRNQGKRDDAMALLEEQERLCRELGKKNGLQKVLGNQALIFQERGNPSRAMALFQEQENLCRELGNKDGLQAALGNQANIFQAQGNLDRAMVMYEEVERLCHETGNKDGLSKSLCNRGLIFYRRGDLDRAMSLLKEHECLCRELGNPKEIAISLANQAAVLSDAPGLRGEARRLAEEALAIATRHGYQSLVPRLQRIRDSIPFVAER